MIKVNENPPSAYPTVETGNIALKADLPGTIECGCRIARNGTMTQEIRFCPLHKAAPALVAALHELNGAIEALIAERPTLAAKRAGSTTLGNHAAEARVLLSTVLVVGETSTKEM